MNRVIESQIRIISALKEYTIIADHDAISKGKRRYNLSKDSSRRVYFITEGDFLLKIQEENKLINILVAPVVFGAAPTIEAPPLYIEKVDYGKIYSIEFDLFWQLINEKGLLEDAMSILSWQFSDLIEYIMLSKSNSHEQVMSLIKRWQRIPVHLKKRFSVLYLLENSSYLSKSSICRVLKELKDKGELVLNKGRFDI